MGGFVVVLWSIAYGARETYRMYRDAMELNAVGKMGRFLWGIYFIIAFIVAIFLTRW